MIDPCVDAQINPNSYNYTLGDRVLRLTSEFIDLQGTEEYEDCFVPESGLVLMPGECYLGSTAEVFGSHCFASLITGRSSIGRKFVTNHITAGLIDIGFVGRVTLEITVQRPTRVYPGVPFGQIYWFTTYGPHAAYQGKYQGQEGPSPSRLAHEFTRGPLAAD